MLWGPEPYCCNSTEILLTKFGGGRGGEKDGQDGPVWFGTVQLLHLKSYHLLIPKVIDCLLPELRGGIQK